MKETNNAGLLNCINQLNQFKSCYLEIFDDLQKTQTLIQTVEKSINLIKEGIAEIKTGEYEKKIIEISVPIPKEGTENIFVKTHEHTTVMMEKVYLTGDTTKDINNMQEKLNYLETCERNSNNEFNQQLELLNELKIIFEEYVKKEMKNKANECSNVLAKWLAVFPILRKHTIKQVSLRSRTIELAEKHNYVHSIREKTKVNKQIKKEKKDMIIQQLLEEGCGDQNIENIERYLREL